jgi:hypothetical protein
MKFTVTVRGEEGVKVVQEVRMSSEMVFLAINGQLGASLEETIAQEIAESAKHAGYRLMKWFKQHGMLVQRSKNGMRECLPVTDVHEAEAWLADGDK